MAKAKKSMVEKQQSADVAEQAHRLAHELGLAHGHSHTEENDHAQILENGGTHDHTEGHGHHHPNSKAVSNRLARAIGHLEAVKRMVDREEDCAEILIQLAAVRSAINNAGKVILMDHLNYCIVEAVEDNDLDKIKEFGDAIQKFIK